MGMLHYLFGFSGRINRAKIWLFILIMIGWSMLMWLVAAFGFDWSATLKSLETMAQQGEGRPEIDFTKIVWPALTTPVAMVAIGLLLVMYVVAIWVHLAVYAKRLHDRNRSAWWLLLYWALPTALSCYAMWTMCPVMTAAYPMRGSIASNISLLIGIWVFLDLYCFRGTRGANRFGNDPLEKGAPFCEPGNPVEGCVPKP